MKLQLNQIPLGNRFKLPSKVMAVLAALGLASAAQAQVTYNPFFSNTWVVASGTYYDLTNSGNNVRGVAINPVTTNVVYASTLNNTNGGAGHVSVLSFASGSNFLAQLNGTNVATGATVNLMNVRVADDGAIYACNRADAGGTAFRIYRWVNDSDINTSPTVVFQGTAGVLIQRLGDHMDVRGSGINTEIVVVGGLATGAAVSTNAFIFRPTDASCTTFTNFSFTIPGTGPSTIVNNHGVTFEGTNNAIYVLDASSPPKARRVSYNPTTLTATVTRTNATDANTCRALKYYASTNGVEMLACVQYDTVAANPQKARVFTLPTSVSSNTAALVSVLTSNFPPPYAGGGNGNGLGQVDAKKGYFVFGAPNCGLTFFKVDYTTTAPPTVTLSASASTAIAGYPLTLTANTTGSAPLSNQWYFASSTATNLLTNTASITYNISSLSTTDAGGYFVIVTNLYGRATSSVVNVTVLPNGASALMTNIWSIAPGSRSYLDIAVNTENQRGLAYDPILQRLILVSRVTTNGVHILDAANGADLGEMDISFTLGLSPIPGTFKLNTCGVADDGAVYACNLLASDNYPAGGADYFAIYRWSDSSGTATQTGAYSGSPLGQGTFGTGAGGGTLGRIGDTMAVRGAGVNTEILCSFRNGTNVAIFKTADGTTFTPTIITIPNLPAGAAGLSVAWGTSNTFWTKADFNLRKVTYDLGTGTGTVVGSYAVTQAETVAGVDNLSGYAATIGTRETPQNLAIYDITTANGPSINTLVDREFFPVSNGNGNFVGAVAMDPLGGRIYALDPNSGVIALSYAGRLSIANDPAGKILSWPTTNSVLQATTNLALPFADVSGATSPYTNTTDAVKFFRLKH